MCSLQAKLTLALLLLAGLSARAQEVDTTANLSLDKSVITEQLKAPMVVNQQGISGVVNVDKIAAIPSFLGNADPIRFVRLLPSVQLNTEAEGGLYMQGSEHSHTLVSQQGVPIYSVSHLLGMFSVFNSPHFRGMKYATSAGMSQRLGGQIDMELIDTVARRIGGEASVGLLSAQGTLTVPTGSNSSLRVSARRTYINLLYGNYLQYNDEPLHYGFTDANITWYWKPTKKDRIWVDAFGCLDHGYFSGGIIQEIDAKWFNVMGALHWNHYFSEATLKQTLYYTTFGMKPLLRVSGISGTMDSYIRDGGYRGSLHWQDWEFGAQLSYFHVQPQNPQSEGHFNINNSGGIPDQRALETVVSAHYTKGLGYYLEVNAGLSGSWYLSPEKRSYFGLSPEVSLRANLMEAGKVDFTYGIRRQNTFQVGLSNLGLPIEFWVMAGDVQDPQWSHNFSLSYNGNFFDGGWSVSAETYYRMLYNQLEYSGNIMDIYAGQYTLESSTLRGHGRAYGVNLMLQRQKGKLTGWVSYAFSRSLRTFDELGDEQEYPSIHERLHELDVVVTYDFGRFDVGATFVLASGTPYTRPTAFYVLNNRVVCEYGPYNAERLPAYTKMDLSANWYFKKGPKGKCGLNFSIYNVFGRKNALGYGLHVNHEKTAYSFRPTVITMQFLPSLAYFHTF